MKKFICILIGVLGFNSSVQASELVYTEYDMTAAYTVGIDFSKAKIQDEDDLISVTPDMISNYNPNKIGLQDVTVSYGDAEFILPVRLLQKAPPEMTADGYIDTSKDIVITTNVTNTYPNDVLTFDVTTSGSAVIPHYSGADGRDYIAYMSYNNGSAVKVWGNANLEYYFTDIENPFIDIGDEWFTDYCLNNYGRGLMTGMSSNEFSPRTFVTKAQICRILYILNGQPKVAFTDSYQDVKATDWFALPVIWYYQTILDNKNSYVNPNFYITRGELANMLYNTITDKLALKETTLFNDVDINTSNFDAIQYLHAYDIISGDDHNNFNPDNFITRAELCVVLDNYIKYFIETR